MWWITVGCLLVKERWGHFKANQALVDVRQAWRRGLSESRLFNLQQVLHTCAMVHWCSYQMAMKSVSWNCAYIKANLVTNVPLMLLNSWLLIIISMKCTLYGQSYRYGFATLVCLTYSSQAWTLWSIHSLTLQRIGWWKSVLSLLMNTNSWCLCMYESQLMDKYPAREISTLLVFLWWLNT